MVPHVESFTVVFRHLLLPKQYISNVSYHAIREAYANLKKIVKQQKQPPINPKRNTELFSFRFLFEDVLLVILFNLDQVPS